MSNIFLHSRSLKRDRRYFSEGHKPSKLTQLFCVAYSRKLFVPKTQRILFMNKPFKERMCIEGRRENQSVAFTRIHPDCRVQTCSHQRPETGDEKSLSSSYCEAVNRCEERRWRGGAGCCRSSTRCRTLWTHKQ